jgi:16S rRNA U516 pseudouridylate synthase RsuA-like enzyme
MVFVNGKKIDSYTQEIVAGDKIEIRAKNFQIDEMMQEKIESSILILFNKPIGCVASKSDPHNKTIYDILPPEYHNYYYI